MSEEQHTSPIDDHIGVGYRRLDELHAELD
jgi:hypothetical protein